MTSPEPALSAKATEIVRDLQQLALDNLPEFVQESVSMCAACGDPYTGSYEAHAASHETELPNV